MTVWWAREITYNAVQGKLKATLHHNNNVADFKQTNGLKNKNKTTLLFAAPFFKELNYQLRAIMVSEDEMKG